MRTVLTPLRAALLLCAALTAPAAHSQESPQSQNPPGAETVRAGVHWFTDLRAGLAEANRTGRPVMLLAAAPSCGGISGTW